MAGAATADRVDDPLAAPLEVVTHEAQRSRRHERNIDRQDEEGVGVSSQPGDSRLNGGEHAGVVVRVMSAIDLEAAEDREECFRVVPRHHDHLSRSRCPERGDHPLDRRHPANRQQGLARPHPGRAPSGEDHRGYPPGSVCAIMICAARRHDGDCSRQRPDVWRSADNGNRILGLP